MLTKRSSAVHLLSSRERDCLRHLQLGLQASEVASKLGIAQSTLNKHLASARRKLGVNRTTQALLALQNPRDAAGRNGAGERQAIERAASLSPLLHDFANVIEICDTFDEAWNALQAHVYQFGITQVNFGVVAEPPGRFTNGARLLKSTLGNELLHLYEQAGGTSTDPCTHYFATHETEKFVDSDFVIKRQLRYAPKPLRTLAESFLDTHLRHTLCLPGRDHITGAPLGFVFSLSPDAASRFRHCPREDIDQLRKATQIFWHSVQRKGLMAEFAALSNRQREALTCAARGYTTAEMAEHMGVSTRSTEKTLAAARDKLGARTTTAAIYRAMVYRALT